MQSKLEQSVEEISEEFGRRYAECVLDLAWFDAHGYFHTEVEHAMAIALRAMETGYGWELEDQVAIVGEWSDWPTGKLVEIQPRQLFGEHVIALAIRVRGPADTMLKIAVQCDGHDLLEMTPEQAKREHAFERALRDQDYQLIRFTGAEIIAGLAECAAKVAQRIDDFVNGKFRLK